MSNAVLIIGESGTGKSSAIRTLPPEETFVINVLGKPLPFRGANKIYTKLSADGMTGNTYHTDNFDKIRRVISLVNTRRPEIKYLVLDDLGYTIQNDYMRKAMLKGYDKFTEMGKEFGELIDTVKGLRDDLFCFITMHVTSDNQGKTKPKTVGKMIDEHVCIEGRFSYVLHTIVSEGSYRFITNNDGLHMAKTPMDLFSTQYIPNDLKLIADAIIAYANDEVTHLSFLDEQTVVHEEEAAYALANAHDGVDRSVV